MWFQFYKKNKWNEFIEIHSVRFAVISPWLRLRIQPELQLRVKAIAPECDDLVISPWIH
jgi:hypothetical protein